MAGALVEAITIIWLITCFVLWLRVEWLSYNTDKNVKAKSFFGWILIVSMLLHLANPERLNDEGKRWRVKLLKSLKVFIVILTIPILAVFYIMSQ